MHEKLRAVLGEAVERAPVDLGVGDGLPPVGRHPERVAAAATAQVDDEPIPTDLVRKIEKAATFNQGFATTEYLACAIVDLKFHMIADPGDIDPDKF